MVCSSNCKHCYCPTCVNDKLLADVRRYLHQMHLKRALLRQKLETTLPRKVSNSCAMVHLLSRHVADTEFDLVAGNL